MAVIVNICITLALVSRVASTAVRPQIKCLPNMMEIYVPEAGGVTKVGLEKWSSMPGCEANLVSDPTHEDERGFLINLKLNDKLPCGTTRIRNKLTGDTFFYHRIFIRDVDGGRRVFKVSCFAPFGSEGGYNRIVKRNVLPAEFVEPDYIEITSEITGTAPVPELSVGVRQNGRIISDHVTVSPGAPLAMEVYLDSISASTYGILVSYLMVTDTTDKNETIIYNGCAQDAYIFENFETRTGDFLTAKFRAFKFPESNYLMFRGTVDVCLDKCQGVRCSNGEVGYGRKRRAIPDETPDPNKIYEVTMMTFIKVEEQKGIEETEVEFVELQENSKGTQETDSKLTFFRRSNAAEDPPFTYFETNGLSHLSPSLWAITLIVLLRLL